MITSVHVILDCLRFFLGTFQKITIFRCFNINIKNTSLHIVKSGETSAVLKCHFKYIKNRTLYETPKIIFSVHYTEKTAYNSQETLIKNFFVSLTSLSVADQKIKDDLYKRILVKKIEFISEIITICIQFKVNHSIDIVDFL